MIRYRRFGDELLLLELANAVTAAPTRNKPAKAGKPAEEPSPQATKPVGPDKSYAEIAATLPSLQQLLASLGTTCSHWAMMCSARELRLYAAFGDSRTSPLWCCSATGCCSICTWTPSKRWRACRIRDVSEIGHWGTGDLELALSTLADLDTAKPLIAAAYGASCQTESCLRPSSAEDLLMLAAVLQPQTARACSSRTCLQQS